MNAVAVDREAAEAKMALPERHQPRRERPAPIVAVIDEKLLSVKGTVLPKSKLGGAIDYTLGQWPRMIAFLAHAETEVSNNLAENSMLLAALGRKNWIHIGSVDAGPRAAAILSVVETCRRLEIPVWHYLADVLPGLSDRKASEVPALTPMAWKRHCQG